MITSFIRIKRKISRKCTTWLTRRLFSEQRIMAGAGMIAVGMPIVDKEPGSSITIGRNCILCSADYSNPIGLNHRTVIRTLASDANITIGDDVGISGASICAMSSVNIGNEVMLGVNVQISDTDFHPLKPDGRRFNKNSADIGIAPTAIEDNVWVGANSIILKGVTIGKNSIIGAGSIVSASIPANCIAAGVPARVIKHLDVMET
ncbi:DapH/DapD/GlmU-related protein [Paenibacillus sp. SGZ-1009]|uniref:DapH/DapD/GlmU-related protein n=1 Tax=Paenibacillus campi TaxID=3106031 RepID=UPI002AFF10AA|nr:DapH/DapD/GlmU-related protein [Paenibacillus sp. SGZ-1009]